jgi:glycosyltransferase involved in cell wall biosynthesis
VQIVGSVENKELAKYYQTHSVFLTTTSYESFGVSIVEAACSGIPQVATSVGEIPLMWENETEILLAKLNDQQQFNNNVFRLLNSKELARNISSKAYVKAKNYTWTMVQKKWQELLS